MQKVSYGILLRSTPVDGEGRGRGSRNWVEGKCSLNRNHSWPYQEVWREDEPSDLTWVIGIIGCAPPRKAMSSGAKWTSLAEATCKGGWQMRASAGGTCVAGIISPFLPKGDLGGAPQSPPQWGRGACGFRWRHPLCYWMYELDT